MSDTESTWATRVAEWRKSGLSAPAYCKDKGFSPSGLRYWDKRLAVTNTSSHQTDVRLARVVRTTRKAEEAETPILIELGPARLGIRRGFDPETLRAVLGVLGGGR